MYIQIIFLVKKSQVPRGTRLFFYVQRGIWNYNSLWFSTHKNVHRLHGDDKFWVVNRIMDEFPFPMRVDQTRSTKNFEMLTCNRLLKFQSVVDFVHVNRFVLIYELKNFHPQRMCQGTQNIRRHLQFSIVNLTNCYSHRACFFNN